VKFVFKKKRMWLKVKKMRTITLIVVHCSAVKPDQMSSAAQIDTWHRERGFKLGIGYHYVIRRDGTIEPGRPEWMIGAHCVNHNKYSIGVCYEGGLDIRGQPADTRTAAQKASLRKLLEELHERYPRAVIVGHHDLNPHKACPCFDAAHEYFKE
jgi:N-acetyl-anhydromuramyl-L-alanine amidase AmpD